MFLLSNKLTIYFNHFRKNNKKIPIICVETGQIYESIREASRQTGISRGGLNSALSKETSTAYGYHWRYVNGKEN